MQFYTARQPILDTDNELIGYELLFRDGINNVFPDIDDHKATTRLIEGTQISLGLHEITDNKLAFINFNKDTIVARYPLLVDPKSLVIEILESVEPDEELLEAVIELKENGYLVALDDYIHHPGWAVFHPYIDIIKFDLRAMDFAELSEVVAELKSQTHIKLLAEKVETKEEFARCVELGFDYFQGYFFAKPEVVKSTNLAPFQSTLVELMADLSVVEVDVERITELIARDVNLSFKLLRYTNSAGMRRMADISSIRQAVVFLGKQNLKRFISLMFAAQAGDAKPEALIRMAIVRARFCELLASRHGGSEPSIAFLTGMMSLIDAIMDEPIEKIMDQLPLSPEIKEALLLQKGIAADYLFVARSFENGNWSESESYEQSLALNSEQICEAFSEAIVWADNTLNSMVEAA